VKDLKEEFCGRSSQDIREELDQAYPSIKSLVLLVNEFRGAYAAEKTARGLVDFNDLEHYCLKILTEGE
jgi:ATP-dependent helicase/nuclease subunit A